MNRSIPNLIWFSSQIVPIQGVASAVVLIAWKSNPRATPISPDQQSTAPVIVELFTSEGCSSCPPADALLARYERQQPVPNAQIIALEEHVDYWNELGWVDPFSSKRWTDRQIEYADSLGNRNPYTPQIVVDGRIEFVGSREIQARQAISEAASQPKTKISVAVRPGGKSDAIIVQIEVPKITSASADDHPEVWLAITERDLHSDVSRGENAGRALNHASIVRELRNIGMVRNNSELAFSQSTHVKLDSRWKVVDLHAMAFVQEQRSRRILGASIANVGH